MNEFEVKPLKGRMPLFVIINGMTNINIDTIERNVEFNRYRRCHGIYKSDVYISDCCFGNPTEYIRNRWGFTSSYHMVYIDLNKPYIGKYADDNKLAVKFRYKNNVIYKYVTAVNPSKDNRRRKVKELPVLSIGPIFRDLSNDDKSTRVQYKYRPQFSVL